MCGILGFIAGPNGPGAEVLTPSEMAIQMFPDIVHRGRDSTGWMHYTGKGTIQLRKFVGPADKPETLKRMDSEQRSGIPDSSKWWIGHVRLATHGTHKYVHNNHPIVHGNIMGVHNGICFNYKDILTQTGRQFKRSEVDSEAIFAGIDKWGIDKGLDKMDALAAVAFVDRTKPNTIHLATCDSNPLIVARSITGGTYFASESWILDELKVYGVVWEEGPWKMGDYSVYTLEDGVNTNYYAYADTKKKWSSGYGSVYSGGYTYDSDTDGGGWTSYTYKGAAGSTKEGSSKWWEDDEWREDDLPIGGSNEVALECLGCGWEGLEVEAEAGTCPLCASASGLVQRELVPNYESQLNEDERAYQRWWRMREGSEDKGIVVRGTKSPAENLAAFGVTVRNQVHEIGYPRGNKALVLVDKKGAK